MSRGDWTKRGPYEIRKNAGRIFRYAVFHEDGFMAVDGFLTHWGAQQWIKAHVYEPI